VDSTASVLFEAIDGIGKITLNRPERLNALNDELLDDLLRVIESAGGNDEIRCLVLTGAGRGFCAGGDMKGFSQADLRDIPRQFAVDELRRRTRIVELLRELPIVTIAAINGACAGAGLSIACAADLRFASMSAVFRSAFISSGLSGDFGSSWLLAKIVGDAKAREIVMLDERISADVALKVGLVTAVFEDQTLMTHVMGTAERIRDAAPLAIRYSLQNLNDAPGVTLSEALDREADRHIDCALSQDALEAARAFNEKRAPIFFGR
jgi:2-(1,2-epoxy-1,2-dihydrophenyl)acetyl-CoA isomerase